MRELIKRMRFTKTEPNENFFSRWVSENSIWEVGFTQMLFGVRVRAGKVGDIGCELDYCAGADLTWQMQLLIVIMTALEKLPESTTSKEIQLIFPIQNIKPIKNDNFCWLKLKKLGCIEEEIKV